jgi:hypothetical protein
VGGVRKASKGGRLQGCCSLCRRQQKNRLADAVWTATIVWNTQFQTVVAVASYPDTFTICLHLLPAALSLLCQAPYQVCVQRTSCTQVLAAACHASYATC